MRPIPSLGIATRARPRAKTALGRINGDPYRSQALRQSRSTRVGRRSGSLFGRRRECDSRPASRPRSRGARGTEWRPKAVSHRLRHASRRPILRCVQPLHQPSCRRLARSVPNRPESPESAAPGPGRSLSSSGARDARNRFRQSQESSARAGPRGQGRDCWSCPTAAASEANSCLAPGERFATIAITRSPSTDVAARGANP